MEKAEDCEGEKRRCTNLQKSQFTPLTVVTDEAYNMRRFAWTRVVLATKGMILRGLSPVDLQTRSIQH